MRTTLLAIYLFFMMPIALLAQTSESGSNDTAPTSEASDIQDQLSMGEDATPTVGQTYISETIGDWKMRCIKTEDGNDPCQMYQLMSNEEDTPIAEIAIFRLPEGGRAVAGATIIVPLETSLPQKLTIQVDTSKPRQYPFSFCSQVGCYSTVGFVSTEVDALKKGSAAALSIVPALAPDQTVKVIMSLNGFTAAYEKTTIADNK